MFNSFVTEALSKGTFHFRTPCRCIHPALFDTNSILGDVAVAVHPNDERYTHLLNRKVMLEHPLRLDSIPLIADSNAVDPKFGTGAVKITPSHDINDFEVGRRLSLPNLTVIDEKGLITFPCEKSHFQLSENGRNFVVRFLLLHLFSPYLLFFREYICF